MRLVQQTGALQWHSASKDERRGFLAGYIDCAAYDVGWKYLLDLSWNAVEPKVTDYYDAHASELQTPVASVFAKLASSQQPRKAAGGESYPEKHGIFDGDYWRQAPASHRLGYIEGYLVCQRDQGKPVATFSNTTEWYVAQISQWYGVRDNDPGEIDEKRVDRKIANALYLLRDNGTGSRTPTKKP